MPASPSDPTARDRVLQFAILVPTLTAIGALGFSTVDQGVFGAGVGLGWSILFWFAMGKVQRSARWRMRLANVPLLTGIVACSTMWGAGLLSNMQLDAAVDTSPELLSTVLADPLGGPLTGVFIVFNTLMEFVVLPAAICLNWHAPPRRHLILAGAIVFYAARVWTYLYFAPGVFDATEAASNGTLSGHEVEVFREWLSLNRFRVENQVIIVTFLIASLLRATTQTHRKMATPADLRTHQA